MVSKDIEASAGHHRHRSRYRRVPDPQGPRSPAQSEDLGLRTWSFAAPHNALVFNFGTLAQWRCESYHHEKRMLLILHAWVKHAITNQAVKLGSFLGVWRMLRAEYVDRSANRSHVRDLVVLHGIIQDLSKGGGGGVLTSLGRFHRCPRPSTSLPATNLATCSSFCGG